MKRKSILVFAMFLFSSLLFAQENIKDEITTGPFKIKVVANPDATYGYEIYKDKKLVTREKSKALTGTKSKTGFTTRENALIAAKRNLGHIINDKKEKFSLDIKDAKALGITDEDLN